MGERSLLGDVDIDSLNDTKILRAGFPAMVDKAAQLDDVEDQELKNAALSGDLDRFAKAKEASGDVAASLESLAVLASKLNEAEKKYGEGGSADAG
jgi:hypothetical protein